ncbi:MAG TPA: hypothetical protein VGM76_00100 [Lacipirellulaceae bacterium]|jgi:hypothetical protein
MTKKKSKPLPAHSLQELHEPITADTRTVSLSLVGLALTIVASLIIVGLLIPFLASINKRIPAKGSNSSIAVRSSAASETPASVPALDPHQADELAELRARDRQILSEYAWIDRQSGVARIPIERAMQILARRADDIVNQSKGESGHE